MSENLPNTPLPTPPEALLERLSAMGLAYTLYNHKAVFTCEESEYLKAEIPGLHVKNLFLRDKKDRMCLVVLPHEVSVDLKAIAPTLGMDRISFGSPERLFRYLGVYPGSVCPFAAINDTENQVQVFLDESVANADLVCAHPMLNTMSITLSSKDLLRFLDSIEHSPRILPLRDFHRQSSAA